MELALKELSYTLAVGFFFFGVVELSFYVLFGSPIFRPSLATKFSRVGMVGSVVALVYVTGLCMDAFSKKWVGRSNTPPAFGVGTIGGRLLTPERQLRAAPLFTIERLLVRPTTFGSEMLRSGRFSEFGGDAGARVESAARPLKAAASAQWSGVLVEEDALSASAALFHAAKNYVYRYPTYFAELKDAENKIDFVRSVTLCAYVLFWTTALLLPVRLVIDLMIRSRMRERRQPPRWLVGLPVASGTQWALGLAIPGLMWLAILGGSIAFDSLVFAHASRVYGYFQSTLQLPSPHASPPVGGRGG